MSVLIVVAHPDDEVLGCGGVAAKCAAAGSSVTSCILSGDVEVRQGRPAAEDLKKDIARAHQILGMKPAIMGKFPNIRLNTVPHIELVQFVEAALEQTQATRIFTHHPSDLNDDHGQIARACLAAARLFQRSPGRVPPLQSIHFMEIVSSTDWAFPAIGPSFHPDAFVEIQEADLRRKIEALGCYRGVMRESPHSRREEVLRGLAAYRGGQAGVRFAEAFQTVFSRL